MFYQNSSTMKKDDFSINKIYGNPDIRTLTNRIKFLENRRKKCHNGIAKIQETIQSHSKTKNTKNNYSGEYIRRTVETEYQQGEKEVRTTRNQKWMELKQLRVQKYKECKENSQRILVVIKSQKQNDYLKKRLKRNRILKEEDQGRKKLSEFQEKRSKLAMKSNKESVKENIAMKSQILKKQLMEEEEKFIGNYQQSLTYKSQLMRKIKKIIQPNL